MIRRTRYAGALLCLLAAADAFAAATVDAGKFLREGGRHSGALRLTGVKSGAATVSLDLHRFEVFARDVQLLADDGQGKVQKLPRPHTRSRGGNCARRRRKRQGPMARRRTTALALPLAHQPSARSPRLPP